MTVPVETSSAANSDVVPCRVFERIDPFGLVVMLESHFDQERFDPRETSRDWLHDRGHNWRHDGRHDASMLRLVP
jgi:hypothetical protein